MEEKKLAGYVVKFRRYLPDGKTWKEFYHAGAAFSDEISQATHYASRARALAAASVYSDFSYARIVRVVKKKPLRIEAVLVNHQGKHGALFRANEFPFVDGQQVEIRISKITGVRK